MKTNKTTPAQKVIEVHDRLINATESFEPIAIYLAYLYPAILKNGYIELFKDISCDSKFLNVLKEEFGKPHFIWDYIEIKD